MNYLRDMIYRLRRGESQRQIAKDQGISRTTVGKYYKWAKSHGFLDVGGPMPDDDSLAAAMGDAPRPPQVVSSVEPYQEVVQELLDQDVEMMAIWQRLKEDHKYKGSYSSVRRFVSKLQPSKPDAMVRVHTAPGEEVQVDFGSVGQLYDPSRGRARRAYVFVATLCYSRHQYAEFVFDQKVPTWIGLHQRAFESWGGVPERVVLDNLKAAIVKALVHDPVVGEAYRRMAQHYSFLVSPTRPYTPRHKGKVENGVHYVKRNFMAGRGLLDILVANQHLKTWVFEVAGVREHGTTHQPPLRLFNEHEKAALQPLPTEAFTLREVKVVKVHPDCHVQIDKSYYSVPYIYVGHSLDAYVSQRMVEICKGHELIVTHPRSLKPGEWHTRLEHYPAHKAAYLERTPAYCRRLAAGIGPATSQVIETLFADQALYRLRSVQAILRLEEDFGAERLEAACVRALHFDDPSYRRIKVILKNDLDHEPLPEQMTFLSSQPHRFARSASEFFDTQEADA